MRLQIPHRRHTLQNGLQLFVHEDARTPIVCVDMWYFVGSKNERPGRTGFAHLFEHLMFEGSKHVPKGQFDELLENAGGSNNGSTSPDRTNYWEVVPTGALELALHLESDRMGWFLETITQSNLDAQRDVVKNERRQSYDNRPYGRADETIMAALYPATHPYHWPVIGWMEDLDAATLEDVRGFFETYYAPNNAALAIAGDVRADQVVELVEKYFHEIPAAPAPPPPTVVRRPLAEERRIDLPDDVHLPRLYMSWHTAPLFADGDAAMDVAANALGAGKASRLYRELVHDLEIAQEVEAYQDSGQLGSALMLSVTARAGVSLAQIESETRRIIETAAAELSERELARARNHIETETIDSLQSVGGFGGKADRLNHYFYYTGEPDSLARDLARYDVLTVEQVRAEMQRTFAQNPVVLRVTARDGAM
jgi:zinc protease